MCYEYPGLTDLSLTTSFFGAVVSFFLWRIYGLKASTASVWLQPEHGQRSYRPEVKNQWAASSNVLNGPVPEVTVASSTSP